MPQMSQMHKAQTLTFSCK